MPVLPHALSATLAAAASAAETVLALDYDGTLAPIVGDPASAFLPESMKGALERAAASFPLVILTGRSHDKITAFLGSRLASRVQLAASHGHNIRGRYATKAVGAEYVPDLAAARDALTAQLADVPGVAVEDNGEAGRVPALPRVTRAAHHMPSRRPTCPTLAPHTTPGSVIH
jgi:trehalose 6-phosphate phosphatase